MSQKAPHDSRRSFLRQASAALALVGIGPKPAWGEVLPSSVAATPFARPSSLGGRPRPTGRIPILQGATSDTETNLRILVPTPQTFSYTVIDAAGARQVVLPFERKGVAVSGHMIEALFISGLTPESTYTLEIADGQHVLDRRLFRTFASAMFQNRLPLRVALISCMNDRYVNDQAEMWEGVAVSEPELMIFNGDCCYVDQRADGTIEGMWSRHVTTRMMLDVFRWDRLVPTLAVWDDHDTGTNDSNSSNPRMGPAGEYFSAMFGSELTGGMCQASGRSYRADFGGVRYLMLDGRSAKTKDQFFSLADERWIEAQVRQSPGPVVLVNGTQFFGGYLLGAESVEKGASAQLKRLLKMLSLAPVPVLFASGDIHFSEVMAIEPELLGYSTFEITSSAIHSRSIPGMQYRSYNRRRIASTSSYNYISLELVSPASHQLSFELACLGARGHSIFTLKDQISR